MVTYWLWFNDYLLVPVDWFMMTSSNDKFPRYSPFVWVIHRWPVNSTHRRKWRGALMFSLICARINGWVNNCEADDMRRHRAHYDVNLMDSKLFPIYGVISFMFISGMLTHSNTFFIASEINAKSPKVIIENRSRQLRYDISIRVYISEGLYIILIIYVNVISSMKWSLHLGRLTLLKVECVYIKHQSDASWK